mgnify:CR=1 FL=1
MTRKKKYDADNFFFELNWRNQDNYNDDDDDDGGSDDNERTNEPTHSGHILKTWTNFHSIPIWTDEN